MQAAEQQAPAVKHLSNFILRATLHLCCPFFRQNRSFGLKGKAPADENVQHSLLYVSVLRRYGTHPLGVGCIFEMACKMLQDMRCRPPKTFYAFNTH